MARGTLAGAMPISSFGQDFLAGAQAGKAMQETIDDIQVNERMKEIGNAVQQAGGSINGIDPRVFSDPVGLKALGQYTAQYNSSNEGLQKAWQNNDQSIMRMYETAAMAPEAYAKTQDPSVLDQASDKLGLPYQTQYNPETKRHEVMYAGRFGPEATGQSYTSDELSNLYGGIVKDPKRFSQLAFQYSLATMRQNEDYLKDSSKWLYDDDGKTIFVPRKMMTENGFRSGYIVTDTANKTSQFMTNEELIQSGKFPKNLQTMKSLFDIEKGREDMANDKARRLAQGWEDRAFRREKYDNESSNNGINVDGVTAHVSKKQYDKEYKELYPQVLSSLGCVRKNGTWYHTKDDGMGGTEADTARPVDEKTMYEARTRTHRAISENHGGPSSSGSGKVSPKEREALGMELTQNQVAGVGNQKTDTNQTQVPSITKDLPDIAAGNKTKNKPAPEPQQAQIAGASIDSNESGMIEQGNIDLNNRPILMNDDGTFSTVSSMSVNFDGKEYLIPTISEDGRRMSKEEAIEQFKKTGKHLGVYKNAESATQGAKTLHNDQEKLYTPKANILRMLDGKSPDEVNVQKIGEKYYIVGGHLPREIDSETAKEIARLQTTPSSRWWKTADRGLEPKHAKKFAQMTEEEKAVWRKTGKFPDRLSK